MSLRDETVAVIGSGPAGLITAHTLLRDGFRCVQVLTRDKTPGGVWNSERVYSGLQINNVHGEYQFSPLEMETSSLGAGRVSGDDMCAYMQEFATRFLNGIIRYEVDIVHVRRDEETSLWHVTLRDQQQPEPEQKAEVLEFTRVVLCTGGCNTPKIPASLSSTAAANAGFRGQIFHSKHFAARLPDICAKTTKFVVVVGGGKSAQDMAAHIANTTDICVTVVFEKADAFLANPVPLPGFIRRSRLLSILAGHQTLSTRLERFLHTTRLGSWFTRAFWAGLELASLVSAGIVPSYPLYNHTHRYPLFWSTAVNDEGVPSARGFHALVNRGRIRLIAPARVSALDDAGTGVVTDSGEQIPADVVLLATGYASSWDTLLDEGTAQRIGMAPDPGPTRFADIMGSDVKPNVFGHRTLASRPPTHGKPSQSTSGVSNIYNGIVPASNFHRRDFAINGAVFTTNPGYTFEVAAHWIASYFLDELRLPPDVPKAQSESELEYAYAYVERKAQTDDAWMRLRYPDGVHVNASYSAQIAFWTWPQFTDELLAEMGVRTQRSGGNWFTWPFKVIQSKELATLQEERAALRASRR
ncbi:FAD/NAD(P)-binding domain-containing protein [Mycena kentingensis (nom. inval.)]|nr:FAD/NAD(P)-binding domain-containing protein [Mycena kentingensis (nom. inval.)]